MKRAIALVTMGMLLLVLPIASRAQTATQKPVTPPAAQKPASPPKAPAVKYDLNTASREDLMKLAGVDAATANKIIAARPFKSKKELVSKKVLSQSEYDRIHGHVMVKTESTTPKKTGK